jgi:perosamine synthetase
MRISNNELYRKFLDGVDGIVFQKPQPNAVSVNWMNAIVIDEKLYHHTKDELIQYLKDNGVETRLLFTGMNKQNALIKYGCNVSGEYSTTDWLTRNGFYLPSASSLREKQILYICELIKGFRNV